MQAELTDHDAARLDRLEHDVLLATRRFQEDTGRPVKSIVIGDGGDRVSAVVFTKGGRS